MSHCPNIKLDDWKKLEDQVGELSAYGVFINNGYEIPTDLSQLQKFDPVIEQLSTQSIALKNLTKGREDILKSLVLKHNLYSKNKGYASQIEKLIKEYKDLNIESQYVAMYTYLKNNVNYFNERLDKEKDNLELLGVLHNFMGTFELASNAANQIPSLGLEFTNKDLKTNWRVLVGEIAEIKEKYNNYATNTLAINLGAHSTHERNLYKEQYKKEFDEHHDKSEPNYETNKALFVNDKLLNNSTEIYNAEVAYMRKILISSPNDLGYLSSMISDQRNLRVPILQMAVKRFDDTEAKIDKVYYDTRPEALDIWRNFRDRRNKDGVIITNQRDLYGDILEKDSDNKMTGYYTREDGIMNGYFDSLRSMFNEYKDLSEKGKTKEATKLIEDWKKKNIMPSTLTKAKADYKKSIKGGFNLFSPTKVDVVAKWRNSQYENLSKDKTLSEMYKYLRDFNTASDNMLPNGKKLGYRLPSITKQTSEKLTDNNALEAIGNTIKSKFVTMADDTAYNQDQLPTSDSIKKKVTQSGETYHSINIPFRGKLDQSYQSYDLMGMALSNRYVSLNFFEKDQIKADLEILKDLMEDTMKVKEFSGGKKVIGSVSNFFGLTKEEEAVYQNELDAVKSNFYKTYTAILNDRLYGEHAKHTEIMGVDLNKAAGRMIGFSADMMLMFNLKGGVANVLTGKMYNFLEGTRKIHYDRENLRHGESTYWKDIVGITKDLEMQDFKSTTNLLMQRMIDTSMDFNPLVNHLTKDTRFKMMANKGILHSQNTMGEHYIQGTIMYSIMDNIKVMKDGKYVNAEGKEVANRNEAAGMQEMYKPVTKYTTSTGKVIRDSKGEPVTSIDDAKLYHGGEIKEVQQGIEFDKNYTVEGHSIFTPKVEYRVRSKVKDVIRDLQGQYDERNRAIIEQNFYGKLMIFLRKYLISGYEKHFLGIGKNREDIFYSEAQETNKEGVYASVARILPILWRKNKALQWNAVTDLEKSNLKFAAYEVGMLALTALVAIGFGNMGDDEPDEVKKKRLYMAAFYAKRLNGELGQFVPGPWMVGATMNTVRTPSATMSTVEGVCNLFYQMLSPTERYERGEHKHELKLYVDMNKVFNPFYKNLLDVDFKRSLDFLNNGNKH